MELFMSTAGKLPVGTRKKGAHLSWSNFPRLKAVRSSNHKLTRKPLTSHVQRAFELAAGGIDIPTARFANVSRDAGIGQDFAKLTYAQFFRCFEVDPGA